MSILKRTGQNNSIASGRRALDLFTNRFEHLRLYLSNLNNDPPREPILYLHGEGGNGKSLLISFLRTSCSKRIRQDIWQYLKEKEDDDFIDNLIGCEGAREVPTAMIDFGMLPRGMTARRKRSPRF